MKYLSRILIFSICLLFISCLNNNRNNKCRSFYNTNEELYDTVKIKTLGQKVYIPVEINNHTGWYLLDTGAGTLINKKTAQILQLKSQTNIFVSDLYNNHLIIPEVIIPKLSIGQSVFSNIHSGVSDEVLLKNTECEFGEEGVIGSNAFQNRIIRIDIHKKILIISNSVSDFKVSKENRIKLKYYKTQKTPIIYIDIPTMGIYEEVEFDIGVDVLYDMSLSQFNKYKNMDKLNQSNLIRPLQTEKYSFFGKQKDTINYQFYIDTLKLNGFKFHDVQVETSISRNSRIGAKLLGLGIVTIDFINNHFYFESFSGNKTINCKPERLGVMLNLSDKNIKISKVKENSVFQNFGIKPGYKLYQINNTILDSLSFCEFVLKDWTYEWNKDSVFFVFLDNNNHKKEVYLKLN